MEDRSPYSPAEQAAYPDPDPSQVPPQGPFYSNPNEQSSDIAEKFIQDAAKFALQPTPREPSQQLNGDQDYVPHPDYGAVGLHDDMEMRQAADQGRLVQGIMEGMSMEQQQEAFAQQSVDANQRKRTKVSRACDECRRKKIRCDATDVDSSESCSSCKKIGQQCLFSRQPLKRGPSKGYIKELADRLKTLESHMGSTPQHQQQQSQQNSLHQPQHEDLNTPQPQQMGYRELEQQLRAASPTHSGARKRTHSVSDGRVISPQTEATQAALYPTDRPWSPEVTRQVPISSLLSVEPTPSAGPGRDVGQARHLQHQHFPSNNAERHDNSREHRQQVPAHRPVPEVRQDPLLTLHWDEEVIDEYYRLVHGTFPLLAHSKARLRARLLQCPYTMREAFLTALDAFVRSSPSTRLAPSPDVRRHTRKAAELIAHSQYDNPATRNSSVHLVYIQALILMALESDNHGPATMRGQVGPPRAEWLGRAIGMAAHLRLNIPRSRDRFTQEDADADDKLGRRIWWILFILDRWHASSTSCLQQLADASSSLLPEDQILLGESTYHLARLSFILGHVCQIMQQPLSLMSAGNSAAPIISTTILGEIDRFRESVESMLLGNPNLVHLCYWHVRLLVLRLTSSTTPQDLVEPAARMANILNSAHTMITPLNHHFAALAAMTLCELHEFEETRTRADDGIKDLMEALGSNRGLMSKENGTGWDSAISQLLKDKFGQLAGTGALVAVNRPTDHRASADSAPIDRIQDVIRYGYLAALVGEEGTVSTSGHQQ